MHIICNKVRYNENKTPTLRGGHGFNSDNVKDIKAPNISQSGM